MIWDIADPANPKRIGQFIPPEKAEDPLGVFYPGEEFVEIGASIGSGFVVASDMNTGLWVFRCAAARGETKARSRAGSQDPALGLAGG